MRSDTAEYRQIIGRHLERGVERPVPEYTVCVSNKYNYHYFTHHGKVDAMNYSTAIFLINDVVRALYVIFAPDRSDLRQQRYMVKTFYREIHEGDYVVVPSTMGHDNLAVAKVTDVDVEVDFDSTTAVPWVVSRIDMTDFNETVKQEDVAIAAIRQAHFVSKKRKLASDLMDAKELMKLPLATKTRGTKTRGDLDSY